MSASPASIQDVLPTAAAVIELGIQKKLHTGVQLYVSRNGKIVADGGMGEARPGFPMTSGTMNLWMSSGKPITAVAIAQLWEQGELALDDPVAEHLPEFAREGKERVTIRHLLTHTGGFRHVETGWPESDWNEIIDRICAAPLEPDWFPGLRAGYHTSTSWFILGEIVSSKTGEPFPRAVRARVCEPLGMRDSFAALPAEFYDRYADRLAMVSYREGGELHPHDWETRERSAAALPGGSFRGPIRELGRFYEMCLNDGALDGIRIVSPQTIAAMTARHRTGMYDETFQHIIDFGLGFIIDSNLYGAETVPYGYGRFSSPRAFGHGGAQSSIGFADPEHGLVIAFVANGMPGEGQHNRRSRALVEAIFTDLSLNHRPAGTQ